MQEGIKWSIVVACLLLLGILIYEVFQDQKRHTEGFADKQSYLTEFYPKRTDIVPGQQKEDNDWIRDPRYKEQYVDVQATGLQNDFCRVVVKRHNPGSMIMACALAGTDGLPSRNYATAADFIFSRDDYFRQNEKTRRADYCRIIKTTKAPNDAWSSMCANGLVDTFSKKEVQDITPPDDIATLLWFYEGAMIWYRFKDDLLDYATNTRLVSAGALKIDQNPQNKTTEGLQLNKIAKSQEQYLRIGENDNLEFDQQVELRQLRAFMFWVRFDEFTNNTHIFDFGTGAGHNNVYLGIEGKGNDTNPNKPNSISNKPTDADVVCQRSAPRELDPRAYMKFTEANVEIYDCPGPEPIAPTTNNTYASASQDQETKPKTANLLFEIWDQEQRKMRIKCIDAFTEKKLHHVCCTVTDMSFRPTWNIYVDGKKIYTEQEGHLPQTNYSTKNYIGRSNWTEDEKFRGTLFDFRMYRTPVSEPKLQKSIQWSKPQLNNPQPL